VARARGAAAVAVGHTRDDQAETILHRIVRGTGLRGLAGMPARRLLGESGSGPVMLVRPLLKVSRQEIRSHLAAIGQPYRDDASNADLARTRARIRHDLLPRLATEYNPAVAEALVRLGGLAAASSRSLRRRVLEMGRVATLSADHDAVILMRPELMQFPRFLRAEVLRLAWRRAGWPEAGMGAERWRRLADLAKRPRARASVGGGIELTTDHALVILRRPAAPPVPARRPIPAESLPLEVPGSVPWVGGRVVVTLDPDAPRDESIDLDRLNPPLWVRAAVPGDRFEPLGMDGRSTPLNDFFRGRRVARAGRPGVALVCDRSGIVWVVGHRIAHRVRRTADTRRTVGLRWEPPSCELRGPFA
ncbi:MAG TPA: ATP-binding protein, partial [Isosphaeraceae bacterium]|nr:ATP-binding protein [Isosphaeraceae bacterium]